MHSILLLALLGAPTTAAPELGRVGWTRDVDAAVASARSDGRPVFALFQEVPG